MLLTSICSISLEHIHVSDTGLEFAGLYFSPFLKIGETLAVWGLLRFRSPRGQHLTRSCAPWRAPPTTLSHEARSTHSFTFNSASGVGRRVCLAPAASHEAAAAFNIPSLSWDLSETVHSKLKLFNR